MIKVLIVDDEAAAGNILKVLIEKHIAVQAEICYCENVKDALLQLEIFKPTLVMLDIEMPTMSGFDFLNMASASSFDVIFTTAYDRYAIKAIRFSALDYLLKPVDIVELQNAINRHIIKQQGRQANQQLLVNNLISNLQQKSPDHFKLALSTMEGVSLFEPADIMYCEGENNYTRFVFINHKPILISKTLGEYEEILEDYHFIRIHKSYLVNRRFIKKIDRDGMMEMSDGKMFPISKRKKEMVKSLLITK